jgi:hypothetical protein
MLIYHNIKHKLINGTLLYAFEYYIFLRQYTDLEFFIFDATEYELTKIKNIFKDRYVFNHKYLDDVKSAGIREIYDASKRYDKAIILDHRTYNTIYPVLKNIHILCYAQNYTPFERKDNLTLYGYYPYQDFDVKEKLQFNFTIYPNISDVKTNKTLVTTLNADKNILKSKYPDAIFRDTHNHITNIFETFDTLIYYHGDGIDTNNRLIVEAFYYNKKVILINNGWQNDSVYFRYHDINENGIQSYILTENNKMIKEYLENSKA